MKVLALAVVPFLAFGSAALAQSAPAAQPAPAPKASIHRHRALGAGIDGAAARRMTDALNLLEADGFGQFKDFHAVGLDYQATVTASGKTFGVTVDPDTGKVMRAG